MLCYFKQPVSGMKYAFANRSLIREDELLDALYGSKTAFKSPIVNEV